MLLRCLGVVDDAVEEAAAFRVDGVHRDDLAPAWAPPAEAGWLRGSVQREGVRLIRRLERGLLAAFGPVPEPEQLLPVGPQRRARLQALLGDGGGRR